MKFHNYVFSYYAFKKILKCFSCETLQRLDDATSLRLFKMYLTRLLVIENENVNECKKHKIHKLIAESCACIDSL